MAPSGWKKFFKIIGAFGGIRALSTANIRIVRRSHDPPIMRSFVSILSTVLSILSVSCLARTLPSDLSGEHSNIARRFATGLAPLQVVYGKSLSEEPTNSLKEIYGLSNDISYGFSGDNYVWLTQSKTINPTKWLRDMTFHRFDSVDGQPDPSQIFEYPTSTDLRSGDLGKGASSNDFRFLYWRFAERLTTTPPFQEAALYRLGDANGYIAPPGARMPPPGWKYFSQDLNQGRGGGFLYVVAR